jgi:uncharacterized membrane protein HdeD (DUF308 family)
LKHLRWWFHSFENGAVYLNEVKWQFSQRRSDFIFWGEGICIKFFSYLITILGSLFTAFGLFPIIFLYPHKGIEDGMNWNWILFQDNDRWFWQVGVITLVVGLIFLYKQKRKST